MGTPSATSTTDSVTFSWSAVSGAATYDECGRNGWRPRRRATRPRSPPRCRAGPTTDLGPTREPTGTEGSSPRRLAWLSTPLTSRSRPPRPPRASSSVDGPHGSRVVAAGQGPRVRPRNRHEPVRRRGSRSRGRGRTPRSWAGTTRAPTSRPKRRHQGADFGDTIRRRSRNGKRDQAARDLGAQKPTPCRPKSVARPRALDHRPVHRAATSRSSGTVMGRLRRTRLK